MRLSRKRKLAILDRMEAILSTPYAWTRGSWKKRTSRGGYNGHQFCLLGAALEAYFEVVGYRHRGDGGKIAEELSIAALARARMGQSGIKNPTTAVFSYNDSRETKKADVLDLIRTKRAEIEAS